MGLVPATSLNSWDQSQGPNSGPCDQILRQKRPVHAMRLRSLRLQCCREQSQGLSPIVCADLKEQSTLVIQSLVMSIDLHRNGKTSFHTNLMKILNSYNIHFNSNHDNLDYTKILHFVDHMQKKCITYWKHSPCNSRKLEFYVFKDSYTPWIYIILMLLEKILIEKHL